MGKYDDILRLPRPISKRHPQMPTSQRAKQFMPFAALKGYGEEIEGRQTQYTSRALLSEEDAALLDASLRQLDAAIRRGEHPHVTVEVFEPRDDRAGEGRCRRIRGVLERIVPELGFLYISGQTVPIVDITDLWQEESE